MYDVAFHVCVLKDGKRDGIGVKRYVDGSTFDGFWKEGKKHGVGVFRPAEVCVVVVVVVYMAFSPGRTAQQGQGEGI